MKRLWIFEARSLNNDCVFQIIFEIMKCDLIGAWFPMESFLLMTVLRHVQEDLSKKKMVDQNLHEKLDEMAELLVKIRMMFEVKRLEMSSQTEKVLMEHILKMEHFGTDISMTYMGSVVFKSTKLLEEKVNGLVEFWESQTAEVLPEGENFCE